MQVSAALTEAAPDAAPEPLYRPGPSMTNLFPIFICNLNDEVSLWAKPGLYEFRVYGANSVGWHIELERYGWVMRGLYGPSVVGTRTTAEAAERVWENREAVLLYCSMVGAKQKIG